VNPASSESILTVKEVSKSFGGLQAVNNAHLSVKKGELRALIGPNGAGKTTLLNLITGIYPVSRGQIHFKNEEITRLTPDRISHKGISRTMQITSLFSGLTVFENIWAAVQSRKKFLNPFIRASRCWSLPDFRIRPT
jgi:ABC-type branched-subunit amino acid transport system ATPase component